MCPQIRKKWEFFQIFKNYFLQKGGIVQPRAIGDPYYAGVKFNFYFGGALFYWFRVKFKGVYGERVVLLFRIDIQFELNIRGFGYCFGV